MSPEEIETWLKIFSLVLSFAAIIYTFYATRSTKVTERFERGSKRMDGLEKRIASTEQTVSTLPTTTDFHRLELQLTKINGALETMRAERAGLTDTLSRMETVLLRHEDHLLDGAK